MVVREYSYPSLWWGMNAHECPHIYTYRRESRYLDTYRAAGAGAPRPMKNGRKPMMPGTRAVTRRIHSFSSDSARSPSISTRTVTRSSHSPVPWHYSNRVPIFVHSLLFSSLSTFLDWIKIWSANKTRTQRRDMEGRKEEWWCIWTWLYFIYRWRLGKK